MEGNEVIRSIFVAWLVLHLAIGKSEAKLSDFTVCFVSCIPKCLNKPFGSAAICAAGCVISCVAFDHRITTPTQNSCAVGCAQSSCTNISTPNIDLAIDSVNSCVDGCITGCV